MFFNTFVFNTTDVLQNYKTVIYLLNLKGK